MARILLVEDDRLLVAAMVDVLELGEHEVRIANTGDAALAALESDTPDLIIADVLMPGISGVELARRVRAEPEWEDIPILFATASATRLQEGELESIPNTLFLRKPFDVPDLLDAVEKILG